MKSINLNLTVNFINEGKSVVAYSPALDISTAGKNQSEARKNFEELVQMFLSDISERGVMNEVLSDLGWVKKKSSVLKKSNLNNWVPPKISQRNIKVPISITQ